MQSDEIKNVQLLLQQHSVSGRAFWEVLFNSESKLSHWEIIKDIDNKTVRLFYVPNDNYSKDDIEIKENIQEFKDSFTNLLSKFPKFTTINDKNINNNEKDIIHGNEDMIHCIMFYVTFQLKNQSKYGSEVYLGKGIADIMFIDDLNKKSVIIELKYDIDSKTAIKQIKDKKYSHMLSKKYETILIGLSVSKDKKVDINYKIIN